MGAGPLIVRVELPGNALAKVMGELQLEVVGPVTVCSVLDALEASYPVLRGTIRDNDTKMRRGFMRFFGCQRDLP